MHVGGNNLSLPHLSLPDVGYLTLSGTVALAECVAANTQLLVIADGDDGYGNHLNTGHLIFDLERVALVELHIEDQAFPKHCGYIAGKRLVPPEAFAVALPALYNWYYAGNCRSCRPSKSVKWATNLSSSPVHSMPYQKP